MSSASEQTVSGPPHVHHMDSVTAYHSAKLGMWLFLATEVLLFGGLFAAFALYRYENLEAFHHASSKLSVGFGATNTAVLLFSSLMAVLAMDSAQRGDNKKVCRYLWITLACGVGFLVIKSIEYYGKYSHEIFPGFEYFNSPAFNKEYSVFFGLYYCMTALHALHVVIGMGILAWVLSLARKNRFSEDYYTPVEIGALYWHLVDLIWIYLFPLLYLVG